MNPLNTGTVTILLITTAAVLTLILCLVKYQQHKKKSIKQSEASPTDSKESTVQPQAIFVDLSPKSSDIVELAIEIWRINNRIIKASTDLPEIQKRGLESSLQKFIKFLDRYQIKIVDHAGEKYNEGMNIDVLSFEKDKDANNPIIKETIEPSITCKGIVIKKGKVIVINN